MRPSATIIEHLTSGPHSNKNAAALHFLQHYLVGDYLKAINNNKADKSRLRDARYRAPAQPPPGVQLHAPAPQFVMLITNSYL